MGQTRKVFFLLGTPGVYERQILRGIAKYSHIHGPWSLFFDPVNRFNSRIRQKNLSADGIILGDVDFKITSQMNIPTITSSEFNPAPADIPCIQTDDEAIGRLGAEYLLQRNLRNLAYCGFEDMSWATHRGESFFKTAAAAGIKVQQYKSKRAYLSILSAWEKEQAKLLAWIKSLPKPVGIMACNDYRGKHILEVCELGGFSVPEEVAVLGVDNDEMICELSGFALSSIALNLEKAGYDAAKLLDNMMKGHKIHKANIVVKPTHVVTRRSTNIIAINDSLVAQAVAFIRENIKKKIQVGDVVEALSVSPRNIEQRFQRELGRSIRDEILRVRTELIIWMLLETNLSLQQIAVSAGYDNANYLFTSFRKQTGTTPGEYRKKYGKI